jgi:hypothetical protein
MGPLNVVKTSADALGWAHQSCQRVLLMFWDGPIEFVKYSAHRLGQAQSSSQNTLSMTLNGPIECGEM